ncbi:hypothetical protein [Flavobacterium gawalongense]|uniref:Lipoprotein n=1 Tax=Flavobacterium gawalongense TaxID=2594432 RepID=A0ABY3CPX4_9FLAO|nr:hypothetical protein [Flavobacterium gawalongense]TRX03225.1 hypothetical protein FNW33_05185 [Flavobacterium gawalongense]TRX09887.1 hypothetical protein FNW12_01875 [Flavobacterium gawalongense]
MKKTFLIAFATALIWCCGPSDTSLLEMNPRKQQIYNYASSISVVDTESSVFGIGGPTHPSRLKEPYPTQAEMEEAIGKADFSQVEVLGELHPLSEEGSLLTLYWWEKDSKWEVPGIHKKGFREIIIAHFDNDGRLRMLEILSLMGFELVGRNSTEWRFIR